MAALSWDVVLERCRPIQAGCGWICVGRGGWVAVALRSLLLFLRGHWSCPMKASFPLTCLHEDPASKYRTSENTLQSMINSEEEAGGRVGVTCPAKELKLHPWGQHPKSAPQSVVRPPPGSHSRPVLSTHGTDTTWDSTQTCRTQGCARGPEN